MHVPSRRLHPREQGESVGIAVGTLASGVVPESRILGNVHPTWIAQRRRQRLLPKSLPQGPPSLLHRRRRSKRRGPHPPKLPRPARKEMVNDVTETANAGAGIAAMESACPSRRQQQLQHRFGPTAVHAEVTVFVLPDTAYSVRGSASPDPPDTRRHRRRRLPPRRHRH